MRTLFTVAVVVGLLSLVVGDRPQPSGPTTDIAVISSVDFVGPEGIVCFGVQVGDGVLTASHCLDEARFVAQGGHGLCGESAGAWQLSQIVDAGRVRGDLGWVGSPPPVDANPGGPPDAGSAAVVVTLDLTGRVQDCGLLIADLVWIECPSPDPGLGCMVDHGDQICRGSSGSPVYSRDNQLVGVVSRGQPCHRDGERIIWVELV